MKEFGLFLSYIEAAAADAAAAQVLSFFVSPKISVANFCFHKLESRNSSIYTEQKPKSSSYFCATLGWVSSKSKQLASLARYWGSSEREAWCGCSMMWGLLAGSGAAAVLKRDCMPWVKIDIVTKQCCKVEHILGKVGLIRRQSSLLFHCSSLAISHNLYFWVSWSFHDSANLCIFCNFLQVLANLQLLRRTLEGYQSYL